MTARLLSEDERAGIAARYGVALARVAAAGRAAVPLAQPGRCPAGATVREGRMTYQECLAAGMTQADTARASLATERVE